MGYGVPAALAAKLAAPGARRWSRSPATATSRCAGMELATAVQEGLPIIVIVVNNGTYGTIRMHQERRFPARVIATDLANPDFAGARPRLRRARRADRARRRVPGRAAARAHLRRPGADRADHRPGGADPDRVAERDPRWTRPLRSRALVSAGELDPGGRGRGGARADRRRRVSTRSGSIDGERALARARAGRERPAGGRAAAGQGPDRRRRPADHLRLEGVRRRTSRATARRACARSRPRARSWSATTTCDEFAWGVGGQNAHWGDTGNPPTPGASPAARAPATPPRSRSAWARSRSAPTPAARCACRRPAASVVGLKTPFGALATDGVFPLAPDLDTVGPMARTVEDCALAWSILSGEPVPEPSLEGKRLGKLARHPSLGEAEAGPHDPPDRRAPRRAGRAAGAGGRRLAGLLRRRGRRRTAACTPSAPTEYGPVISAKLERALRTTPEAYRARPRRDGRVAASGGDRPGGRRDRLARCWALPELPAIGTPEHEFRIPFSAYARTFNFLGWPAIAIGRPAAGSARHAHTARGIPRMAALR